MNYGEPWHIMNFSQKCPIGDGADAWTTVFNAKGETLHHDYAYNENPFSKELIARIVACINFCAAMPTEYLESRMIDWSAPESAKTGVIGVRDVIYEH